ncbi:hypothetical protein D3C81_528440 [compost metagenome]
MLGDTECPRDQVDLLDRHVHGIVGRLQFDQQHELVAAYARQRVLTVQVPTQARRHRLEQQVADMVAEGIVDRLEPVQIDEHQRKATALLRHFANGLLDTVGQQRAVGQRGQGVVQGQLREFLVGQGQRAGKLGSTGFEAGIQHRGQQGHREHGQGGDQYQVNQPITLEPTGQCSAETALWKVRGGHAGVMHADDGNAHYHRRQATELPDIRGVLAQTEGNPQRRRRGADRNHQRSAEQRRVVVDARQHAQRRHAGVMHATDPCPHDQGAEPQLQPGQPRLAHQPQGKARRQHGDQQ